MKYEALLNTLNILRDSESDLANKYLKSGDYTECTLHLAKRDAYDNIANLIQEVK